MNYKIKAARSDEAIYAWTKVLEIFFFFSGGDFWDFREMQRLTCFESFYKGLAKEEGENQTDPASRLKQSKHNTVDHRKLSKKRRK
jgi:hypothetical protein